MKAFRSILQSLYYVDKQHVLSLKLKIFLFRNEKNYYIVMKLICTNQALYFNILIYFILKDNNIIPIN